MKKNALRYPSLCMLATFRDHICQVRGRQTGQRLLGKSFLLLTTILATGLSASAASIVFNASGTFSDGSTLGGTLTVDTTIGQIIASNLIVSGPSSFTFVNIVNQSFTQAPGDYNVGARNAASTEDFNFDLPDPTQTALIGYNGGRICSSSQPCVGGRGANLFNLVTGQGGASLTVGALTPSTTSVPEPTSSLFAIVGLLGLGALRYQRQRRLLRMDTHSNSL